MPHCMSIKVYNSTLVRARLPFFDRITRPLEKTYYCCIFFLFVHYFPKLNINNLFYLKLYLLDQNISSTSYVQVLVYEIY